MTVVVVAAWVAAALCAASLAVFAWLHAHGRPHEAVVFLAAPCPILVALGIVNDAAAGNLSPAQWVCLGVVLATLAAFLVRQWREAGRARRAAAANAAEADAAIDAELAAILDDAEWWGER